MKFDAVALCSLLATAFASPIDLQPRAQGTRTVTQTITGPQGHITKTVTRVATGTNVSPIIQTQTKQTTIDQTVTETNTVGATKTKTPVGPTTTPQNTVTVTQVVTGPGSTKTKKGSSPTGGACSGAAVGTCTSQTVGCTCSVINLLGVAVYGTCSAGLLGGYSCNIL